MVFKVAFWRLLTRNQKLRLLKQKAHIEHHSAGPRVS